jgi:hypothetical protein
MTTKEGDVKQKSSTVTKFCKSLIFREIKIKARTHPGVENFHNGHGFLMQT